MWTLSLVKGWLEKLKRGAFGCWGSSLKSWRRALIGYYGESIATIRIIVLSFLMSVLLRLRWSLI